VNQDQNQITRGVQSPSTQGLHSLNTHFKLVRDQCEDQDRHMSAYCTYLVIHQIDPNSKRPKVGLSALAPSGWKSLWLVHMERNPWTGLLSRVGLPDHCERRLSSSVRCTLCRYTQSNNSIFERLRDSCLRGPCSLQIDRLRWVRTGLIRFTRLSNIHWRGMRIESLIEAPTSPCRVISVSESTSAVWAAQLLIPQTV
jgi:hypothetical protein